MEGGVANHEAQYHPSAAVRPPKQPRDECLHLPQIASAQGMGEKKRATARARAEPGEGPAIVWVESALEVPRRFGKPLERSARDQAFASEVNTTHVCLQRAGVEVATFLDETGATSWATEQVHRVVCVCLQLGSRDILTDPDAVTRMIVRYTSRGLSVIVVQPMSNAPAAHDPKVIRVCKRVCGDTHAPVFFDTQSAMQCIMELVATNFAFVNGRLRRVDGGECDEVSAPSRADSARRSPTRMRPTPPAADPLPPEVDVDAMLGIGIIQPAGSKPDPAALPRAPRFLRPKKVAHGAANRRHAVAAAASDPTRADATEQSCMDSDDPSNYCSRCELLEQQLDLVQADLGSQRAMRLEAQVQSLQEAKDDQEQVLKARIALLEKQAISGSRLQEVRLLEQQIVQRREAAEAQQKQIVDAAKAEKAKALRQQKFKMARYLTELSEQKAIVEDLKGQVAKLTADIAGNKKQRNDVPSNKDEEAVQLAMQLADLEVEKKSAEDRVRTLQAALSVEKSTVAALRSKVPPVSGPGPAARGSKEYIEAIEGMEKVELEQALIQGMQAEGDAAKEMIDRWNNMDVDQMRSLLRQSLILQEAGLQPLSIADSGQDKVKSNTTPTLSTAKEEGGGEGEGEEVVVVEEEEQEEEEQEEEDVRTSSTLAPKRTISLAAALASKSGATRWLEQARAAALARKLMAADLEKQRSAKTLAIEDGSDAPAAVDRLDTFTAADQLRAVVKSRAVRTAVMFKAQVTAQTKAKALQLKAEAATKSESEDFAAAIADLDAAITLWPDHPVDCNSELTEARKTAQQRLDGQNLFGKAEQLFSERKFESACEAYHRAADLWPENEAIPRAKKSAEDQLKVQNLTAQAEQALVEGTTSGLQRAVQAYREALALDPDYIAIQTACSEAEQKLRASVLSQQGMDEMERAEFSTAVNSFAAAVRLNSELAPKIQGTKEECERKAAAMQLLLQADLQLEHKQFDPAIATYTEALELWGAAAGPQKDEMAQKLQGAEVAKEEFKRKEAEAAAEAAAQALLAELDKMRSTAESQLANRDFDACLSTCAATLALDQQEDYVYRKAILALKQDAENKLKAAGLLDYGKEQLAANDFRAVDTLSEALILDPDCKEIADLKDLAERKREAREKQVAALRKKAEQRAQAKSARKKVKKAAVGTSWLAAAQHQAAALAEHLKLVEEDEEEEALATADPAELAAAAAESFGPSAVGAARAAARKAIEEGFSAEGAAVAGAAAASVVAAGLAKAAEEAGRKAAAKFKEDEIHAKEDEAHHNRLVKLKMATSLYQQQVSHLTAALRESEKETIAAFQFVEESTANLENVQAELEYKEQELQVYQEKEKMLMELLDKAGLVPADESTPKDPEEALDSTEGGIATRDTEPNV